MTPAGKVRRLLQILCSCTALALASLSVAAQPPGVDEADDAGGVGGAPAGPPAYQDHYISTGTLPPDISLGETSVSDASGLARAIRIDGVVGTLTQDSAAGHTHMNQEGAIVSAQWDTMSYGSWSFDGAAGTPLPPGYSNISGSAQPSFALIERGMPFDGNWQADAGLGDLNSPLIGLARQQPRFLLVSSPLEGLTTEWRGPSQLQLVAGGGEPGVFQGLALPGWQPLGGSTATAGAEWSPAPQWALGAQAISTRDANLNLGVLDGVGAPSTFSSSTGYLTAAWAAGSSHAQFNLVEGTINGGGTSVGAWLDAGTTQGFFTHSGGLFYLQPNLAWGTQLMASDIEGGYYRMNYQSRRWLFDLGVDEALSVSGNSPNVTFLTGDTRYQLTRDSGIGGTANFSLSSGNTAYSVTGYLDDANSWGTGRAQLGYASAALERDVSATLQQSWHMPQGTRLATTLAVDQVHTTAQFGFEQMSTIASVALYGGGDFTSRVSVDGNIQWAQAIKGNAAPSTSANLSLTWRISNSWSTLATYYENRIGTWTQLVVNSPLTPPVPTQLPSAGARGFFLTLRWQEARGSHFAPLGGLPGMGAGRITGVIYLDANENGKLDAGEAGVANLTVILDGRYSVRTDANGRFDFPGVVAGHHVLSVPPDNLPLPWALGPNARREVDVSTRDTLEVDFGAVRIR